MKKFPFRPVDLTHALTPSTPTWDGGCGFNHQRHHDYDPGAVYQFRVHKIAMNEGIGTHMDAPAHCCAGGKTIDELRLEQLIVPCVVIDVSALSHEGYSLGVEDVLQFESTYGEINSGSFVMVKTGWSRVWQEPEKYRNHHKFPDVSKEAAELLLERDIAGLGIDTLSPDRGDTGFPVHKLLLGAGKYLVENAADLDSLPPVGAFIMVVPIKIQEGTEAPVRLIGLLE